MMLSPAEVLECIKTATELRKKLNICKENNYEEFSLLNDAAKSVFNHCVKGVMTPMQFAIFCAVLSLQSAECFIREQAENLQNNVKV